ncbi:MAG TPA: 2OG-Fe(II) oxygenase [Rhodopila sp.]|jgi:predicted 2-oxoglutarate/Fe(II)-dependent dioxygenase YbiX
MAARPSDHRLRRLSPALRCRCGPSCGSVVGSEHACRHAVGRGCGCSGACLDCLDSLPREDARDVSLPIPAIALPNLLSPRFCRELIELFETSLTIDGTVSRVDAYGTTRNVVDHGKKRRRDMRIDPVDDLHRTLEHLLLSRCAPEIAKAFQAKVTHIDRLLVSRYDDSGGWFRRHRDNAADNVAFREFAISVNLNTGDYEGGHLLFPEYNDHRYAPPTGSGLIFSTRILHEAAPVTAGYATSC